MGTLHTSNLCLTDYKSREKTKGETETTNKLNWSLDILSSDPPKHVEEEKSTDGQNWWLARGLRKSYENSIRNWVIEPPERSNRSVSLPLERAPDGDFKKRKVDEV